MKRRVLVGIDDTDYGESIGTGALARELKLYLGAELGVDVGGITRHQLLVHPDVPYTSHNSAACLEVHGVHSPEQVARGAERFVRFLFHEGADPGLCVALPHQFDAACRAFGRRAQEVVVQKSEALELAAAAGVLLHDLGGTGDGVIGALAACALRADGNDGRFISLRGIRDVEGSVTAAAILDRTGIDAVLDESDLELAPEAMVETDGWVRPELRAGRIVLPVVRQVQTRDQDGNRYAVRAKKRREKTFEK